jgi:hypothetical protein
VVDVPSSICINATANMKVISCDNTVCL